MSRKCQRLTNRGQSLFCVHYAFQYLQHYCCAGEHPQQYRPTEVNLTQFVSCPAEHELTDDVVVDLFHHSEFDIREVSFTRETETHSGHASSPCPEPFYKSNK